MKGEVTVQFNFEYESELDNITTEIMDVLLI